MRLVITKSGVPGSGPLPPHALAHLRDRYDRSVSSPASVKPADAHAALTAVVPRVGALVRSIDNPTAHAIGNWNSIEVAVHLAHVWENLTALAAGNLDSPLQDITGLGSLTEALVQEDGDRDPGTLADRIDVSAAAFLSDPLALTSDVASPWLVEGVTVPPVTFACHILSESLVHGYDIARAQRRRWTIEPAHAGLALMGFAFPVLARLDPRALVDPQRARGVNASYEITVRGAGHVFVEVNNGAATVTQERGRRVDCHLSVDPASFLLLLFGRVSRWRAILFGRLLAWGPRPWLAPKLRHVLRNP